MLVMDKLGQPQHPVWDACAGAGGKTCSLMETGTEVRLATDTSLKRLATLKQQCDRLGLPQPAVSLANATQPPLKDWCGDILADVPCSGLGVLRSRPDSRWRKKPQNCAELAAVSHKILAEAAERLRPGGRLLFSTCTISETENEAQLERFLAEHPDFAPAPITKFPQIFGGPNAPQAGVQILPFAHGLEGFYFALLLKRG